MELGLCKDKGEAKSATATPIQSVASTPAGKISRASTITPTGAKSSTPTGRNLRSSATTPKGTKIDTPTGSTSKKRRLESLDDVPAVQSSSPAVAGPSIPPNSPIPPVDQTIPRKWRDNDLRELVRFLTPNTIMLD